MHQVINQPVIKVPLVQSWEGEAQGEAKAQQPQTSFLSLGAAAPAIISKADRAAQKRWEEEITDPENNEAAIVLLIVVLPAISTVQRDSVRNLAISQANAVSPSPQLPGN